MKKAPTRRTANDLRPEYDLTKLKGGVRGKYFAEATAGTNLVLVEPELIDLFPDSDAVNRALRLLADTAQLASGKVRSRRATPNRRLKRTG